MSGNSDVFDVEATDAADVAADERRAAEAVDSAVVTTDAESAQSAQDEKKQYVERVIARARELRISDIFAAPESQIGKRISAAQAKATTAMHARNERIDIIVFVIAAIVVVLVSLCLPYRGANIMGATGGVNPPTEVLAAYGIWIKTNILGLFSNDFVRSAASELEDFSTMYGSGAYQYIINRVSITFLVIICGIMLAVSGALFQTTFKNPIAAPTMLGVSDGVTLGGILFCLLGSDSIATGSATYALLVYGCGAAVVILVFALSRFLSGGSRYNVLDMLLLGTVISQFLGGINQYIQMFIMSEDEWDSFYAVQQASDAASDPFLQLLAVIVFVVSIGYVLTHRFKLNLLAFNADEGEMMGVRMGGMRAMALIMGSLMELAAMATVGQVAMLSLAVPFLSRYLLPADFRTQFLGNCLIGSLFLLVCMVIQHFFTMGYFVIPLGTIVSVAIVPFFVWVATFAEGRWS